MTMVGTLCLAAIFGIAGTVVINTIADKSVDDSFRLFVAQAALIIIAILVVIFLYFGIEDIDEVRSNAFLEENPNIRLVESTEGTMSVYYDREEQKEYVVFIGDWGDE